MRRLGWLGVLVGATACLRPNPEWNPGQEPLEETAGTLGMTSASTTTASTGPATTSAATSASNTSSPTDPSTTEGASQTQGDSSESSTGDLVIEANIAFVSSGLVSPQNLDSSLVAADSLCNALATEAGLEGTYVAWLPGASGTAPERLGSARGWVRVDGRPVADTVDDLLAGYLWHPINRTETGDLVVSGEVMTGTRADGLSTDDCANWRFPFDEEYATGSTGYTFPRWTAIGFAECFDAARVYCFGVDKMQPVQPEPADGRVAFVTQGTVPGSVGRPAMDALCQTEASQAGLAGTYLAFVGLQNEGPLARFDLAGPRWVNTQGVPIMPSIDEFQTDRLRSPVAFSAAGLPVDARVWDGATTPTSGDTDCGGWTSMSGFGSSSRTDQVAQWLSAGGLGPCAEDRAVYCFEE